ncbi:MAG: hypothetical protein AB7F59_05645 [Bdellovibrionales bacterium]
MKNYLAILFLFLASACASPRHYDSGAQEAPYHEAGHSPIIFSDTTNPNAALIQATYAVMFSSDYYTSSKIGGDCKFKNAKSSLPFPCRNVKLILRNSDGTEVSRAQTNENGAFMFASEKDKKYFIEILGAKSYEGSRTGTLTRGQKIIIEIALK